MFAQYLINFFCFVFGMAIPAGNKDDKRLAEEDSQLISLHFAAIITACMIAVEIFATITKINLAIILLGFYHIALGIVGYILYRIHRKKGPLFQYIIEIAFVVALILGNRPDMY